jgi:hypothetical protein
MMANVITFEKCTSCDSSVPHGYLIGSEKGKLMVPIHSFVEARHLVSLFQKDFGGQDMAVLEQQMRDAGLPEVKESNEKDVENVDKFIGGNSIIDILALVALFMGTDEPDESPNMVHGFSMN